jgi:bifunctional UDP-N-acetylglucosamine pyrophosphorylase/glucosamine-1-phosphate N-acetyltransferase
MRLATVVLAAGEGTRMKSRTSKILHPLAGKPIARYVLDTALAVGAEVTVFVVGRDGEEIKQVLGADQIEYVLQAERRGTGHAAMQARVALQGRSDLALICYADMPLLKADTLRELVANQARGNTAVTILTLVSQDSRGFGRVIRNSDDQVIEIVEEKVCTPEQLAIQEINCGIYCFDATWLWSHIDQIPLNPVKHEYFLTDMVGIAVADGQRVEAIVSTDPDQVIGINNRVHLAHAEAVARRRINEALMLSGVTIQDPSSTYIDASVHIGPDTTILANTHIYGHTEIGQDCTIGPNSVIYDSTIGNRCRITASVIEEALMEDDCDIGPFGHLRPRARMCAGAHMGNFGEMKNATLGPGAKMGHFSYLGDTRVGAEANIGAGTITCNFDGQNKHPTTIGEGAFIGSGTMLVAPVNVGAGAKTGAGSVVTHDVPPDALVYGVPARPATRKNAGSNSPSKPGRPAGSHNADSPTDRSEDTP